MFATPANISLLIADDDDVWRSTLCSVFAPTGWKLFEASNGKELLEVARNERVNCILTDYQMPILNGLEAWRILRREVDRLAYVLMTANTDQRCWDEARELRVYSVLAKPVSKETLCATITQALAYTFAVTEDQLKKRFIQGVDMKVVPLNDKVLVKRIEAESKTAGGIVLPDSAKEKPREGKILAVGQAGCSNRGSVRRFR